MANFLEVDEEGCLHRNNYTREKLDADVELLKEWIEMQPHLPQIEDKKLRLFIIRSKFSLEKSKRRVDAYCALKSFTPEVVDKYDPLLPENELLFKTALAFPLKKLTPNLERVLLCKNSSDEKCQVTNMCAVLLMIEEIRLLSDYSYGIHFIYDLETLNMNIMKQLTPVFIKKFSTLIMDGYGAKLSTIHILNGNHLDFVMLLLKQILKPKHYSRIIVHKNLESLHEKVPKSILPVEYGGTESTFDELRENWYKICLENREYLLQMAKLKSDESKRPEDQNDHFGSIHGTFRKLNVD